MISEGGTYTIGKDGLPILVFRTGEAPPPARNSVERITKRPYNKGKNLTIKPEGADAESNT